MLVTDHRGRVDDVQGIQDSEELGVQCRIIVREMSFFHGTGVIRILKTGDTGCRYEEKAAVDRGCFAAKLGF